MRLKVIDFPPQPKHKGFVGCVGWNSNNELISCGDDHKILQFKAEESSIHEPAQLTKLSEEIFPTDIHFIPKASGSGAASAGAKGSRVEFVLTCTNGHFILCTKSGVADKTVEAHRGAILAGRWNYDGSALATCGEDGEVKIWSKSGMLRSKLQLALPVYTLAWGPGNEAEQSQQFVYSQGNALVIASTKPANSPVRWKAHDDLILKVDWNPTSNLIVSGGEDRKYKVWDGYGRNVFSSTPQAHDHPVTAVSWSPDGSMFAVGSYNTLRLCDKNGPSMSLEKREMGSVLNLAWSNDSTQVAGACALGHVVFGNVVDKKLEWKNFEAIITGPKQLTIVDISTNVHTKKELHDRIINAALGHQHLVVVTMTSIYIFNVEALGVKDHHIAFSDTFAPILGLCPKYFAVVHSRGINMYFYDSGKQMKGTVDFKTINVNVNMVTPTTVSFASDTIAVKDQRNERNIHFYTWDNINAQWLHLKTAGAADDSRKAVVELADTSQGAHQEIVALALDQHGPARHVAFIDRNNDVYLKAVPKASSSTGKGMNTQSAANQQAVKLTSMVSSMAWCDSANMLAVMHDATHFSVLVYPNVVFVDRDLLPVTILKVENVSDFGKNPVITGFVGNQVLIGKADGSRIATSITPYATVLHEFVKGNRYDDAERLCNFLNAEQQPEESTALWASLAAMAVSGRNLPAAQAAYAAIMEIDKVEALQAIAKNPNTEAEMFLFQGLITSAEERLLPASAASAKPEDANKIKRAIEMNMEMFRWRRALELAKKFNMHIEQVVEAKARYNRHFGKPHETDKLFREIAKQRAPKS